MGATHRHRYFGVLAPNSPLRPAVTALVQDAAVRPGQVRAEPANTGAREGEGKTGAGKDAPAPETEPAQPVQPKRPAHYLWAVLIARIYEVFPLLCPICGGQMRIISFITHSADICQILEHIGVDAEPPRITPARGPPLCAKPMEYPIVCHASKSVMLRAVAESMPPNSPPPAPRAPILKYQRCADRVTMA